MMEQSVTDARFMNVSWFGVGYVEGMIATVGVGFVCEVGVEQ